jgi:hypothetical protein
VGIIIFIAWQTLHNIEIRVNMCSKLERYRYYLGTAQVRFRNLYYSPSNAKPDDCVGCCMSDIEHNLPALICPSEYHDCLVGAHISSDALYAIGSSPRLALPIGLELPCLHGRFRFETAKRDESQGEDDWWLVDLYSSGERSSILFDIGC